jgi:hypothetical protein
MEVDVVTSGAAASTSSGHQRLGVPQFVVECHDPAPTSSGLVFGAQTGACDQVLDGSTYTVPSLPTTVAGTPVAAAAIYRPGPGVDPTVIQTMPTGLDILATGSWSCGTNTARPAGACPAGRPATFVARFPDCWDGLRLARPAGDHMRPSVDGGCPPTHPVHVPQLVLVASYPPFVGGGLVEVPLGAEAPTHARFTNGWDPAKLGTEVVTCLHRQVTCGLVDRHLAVRG